MNNTFELNPVFSGLKPSSTLYINEAVNKLWKQGEQVFHMGFGESRFDVHPLIQQAICEHADKKSYLPARGLPQLIDTVAAYHSQKLNINFDSSQVIIGPGSKSLIYGLQMVLNADVFLPTPSWVSYAPQAHLLGGTCFKIPSSPNDNYRFNIAELDTLIKASNNPNKLLILNTPNNPSGEVFSAQLLEGIAEYCRANNILVLSDEIYFQVCFGKTKHVSIAQFYPEGTIITGGLSKHLSLGGWRVGVGLLPDTEFGRQLMNKMVVYCSETWSGVAAPIQYAAITAYSLNDDVEEYISNCVDIHRIRTEFIRQQLTDLGVRCSGGGGAFYSTVNFDQYATQLSAIGVNTSSQLANHLLTHYRIASLPGDDFGIPDGILSVRLSTSYLDMENDSDPQRLFSLYKTGIDEQEFMSKQHHPNTHQAIEAFSLLLSKLTS